VDRGRASWRIEYDGGGPDKALKAAEVTNTASGAIKTAIFAVKDGCFGNNLPGMIDFRIYNGGKEDITVRLVRVVKLPRSRTQE
jgi:uncharacterized sodium:solute symporter family permease YidK